MKLKALLILPLLWMCFGAAALDQTCRPNGNGNTLWSIYNYTNIDEAVSNPDAGGGDYAEALDGDDNEQQAYTLAKPGTAYATISKVVVHVYVRKVDTPTSFKVGWSTASTWYDSGPIALTTSYAWYSAEFNGSWTKAQLDAEFNVRVSITTMGASDEINVDVLYVVATTAAAATFVPTITIL